PMDSARQDFWEERYRSGRTPWDLGGVPPALETFLRTRVNAGSVLIPGCGSAYEVETFRAAGWTVVAVDFSQAAVAQARVMLGSSGAEVRLADFFADDFGSGFDLIYERTFLCSLPPARWPAYARRVAGLLKQGGVLAGVFAYGIEMEPPPFPLPDEAAAHALLGDRFERTVDIRIPRAQSPALFAGKEHWQEWHRRETPDAEGWRLEP
ncbi:MAG: methyltransferase, partial [Candidatus Acidiferrales bacterium]